MIGYLGQLPRICSLNLLTLFLAAVPAWGQAGNQFGAEVPALPELVPANPLPTAAPRRPAPSKPNAVELPPGVLPARYVDDNTWGTTPVMPASASSTPVLGTLPASQPTLPQVPETKPANASVPVTQSSVESMSPAAERLLDIPTPVENKPVPRTTPPSLAPSASTGPTLPTMTPPTPSAPATVATEPPQRLPNSFSLPEIDDSRAAHNVTLTWQGPAQIKVGRPFAYDLLVRNLSNQPARQVVVDAANPAGVTIQASAPPATTASAGQGYRWVLGDLGPQQEVRIRLDMVANAKGVVNCQATVTASSDSTKSMRISEPKLMVRQSVPTKATLGDPLAITLTISNPGDGSAEGVVVLTQFTEGLTHEGSPVMSSKPTTATNDAAFSFDIGTLAAGETRTLQLVAATTQGGVQQVTSVVTAEDGLKAEAADSIQVAEPKLELVLEGPRVRYLDRAATYKILVSNPGDAPANNVKVAAVVPDGFQVKECTDGGRHDYSTRSIAWFVGTIAPNTTKTLTYDAVATAVGPQKHTSAATDQRGLKAEAESTTVVEATSSLMLDVADIDDPVEVGADTGYEIRVTNQGSREATNVIISALVPTDMQIQGGHGPMPYKVDGQEIRFEPLPRLAPRADVIYRVQVRGQKAGDIRFRAQLQSDSLTHPVIEEESTKVYGD